MQTAYVIKADGEAVRRETCAGTNTDTWRRSAKQPGRKQERKEERKSDFSANSLTQQLFHSNLGLLSPKQRTSVSGEPNKQFCQPLKFKAIKGGGPAVPLPPGYFHSTSQKNVTKATNSAANEKHQRQAPSVIYGCVFSFFICTCL